MNVLSLKKSDMKETGWVFIASAIVLTSLLTPSTVGEYFGDVYALPILIIELIIIGVLLIKFRNKI